MLDIAYAITIAKNHKLVWQRDHYKETLGDKERKMYDNYKNLEEQEDRDKYSPKIPRFGGDVRVKKTFGSVMWNKEGMFFYNETTKIWKEAICNDIFWE